MLRRLLLSGILALGVATTAIASAAAQASTPRTAVSAIRDATVLSSRIRSYHRGPGSWTGHHPPPAGYCVTMRQGEAALVEIARLANRAILSRQPSQALHLQRVGDALSDELDEEERINGQADIRYADYPCPAVSPYPARAHVLRLVEQSMPTCRRRADALRLSFAARRSLMQQCLQIPRS